MNDLQMKNFRDKVEAELWKFLYKVLLKLQADSVDIIDKNKAVAWGEMRRNVRYEVYKDLGKMVGQLGVGSNVPYGIFRHEGTRPHWPPMLALYQWVIKKGFVKVHGKPTTLGRLRSAKQSESTRAMNEIKSIAFLVARKISRKGTTGLPFLKMALNQNLNWITSELQKIQVA